MTSSYSTDLKLELMVTGENAGTWGDKTNTNLNLLQQAIAGYEAITITDSATTTLTMSNAALSNARNMVIKINTITLTGATSLAIPDGIEKFYIIDARAITAPTNLTVKTASGTGFTLDAAKIYACYSDGTNVTEVSLDTLGGSIGTAQINDSSITAAKISTNAITTDKILQSNVTTAKLAASAVTGNNIAQSTITQAKLAADSVGSNQLIATTVTPGTYTSATITVDADGRLTSAASGSAGAGGFVLKYYRGWGSASGTYTVGNGNLLAIYAAGAGGGGGGGEVGGGQTGGHGGGNLQNQTRPGVPNAGLPSTEGAPFGMVLVPTSPGTTYPYAVGSGGNYGNPFGTAGSGGNTYFGNVLTLTGGAGGVYSNPGGNPPPSPATPGTFTPGTWDYDLSTDGRCFWSMPGYQGRGGPGWAATSQTGNNSYGQPGVMAVFENSGT